METFSSWIVTVQLAYLKLYSGKKRNILYIIYMKVLVKSIIYIAPVLYSLISSFKKKLCEITGAIYDYHNPIANNQSKDLYESF